LALRLFFSQIVKIKLTMSRIRFFIVLFILISDTVKGQLKAVHTEKGYSYWLHVPKNAVENTKLPVLIVLHGRSLSGNNLNRVKRYGVLRAMERGKEIEAVIVAPQTNSGWDPDKIMEVLEQVLADYPADSNRVYVCGMSMRAYGTMDLAGKYPERIAAAVAICGGGNAHYACSLTEVPIWLQHGSADRIIPPSESKALYQAIKRCDEAADTRLTIIPGGTHGSVERLFHGNKIYEFMFRYRKSD